MTVIRNLPKTPRDWRTAAGLRLLDVAGSCGIEGQNPARTYSRYERGSHQAPAPVIEAVKKISKGQITAESWQAVRMAFLQPKKAARAARRGARA